MAIPVQKLPSLEEAYAETLFGTAAPINPDEKKVVMVEASELIEIEDQPFHPYPPYRLAELAEDIKENGQINPCTVRQLDGKKYILAGRNRKKACEFAGIKVACIFIECDDATANLILVNSNLNQRQKLLPSELAFAYKLQKESYEAKGQKKSTAAVAEENNENVKKIQRYIKLTDLIPDLMKMVDEDQLPIMVGYELSYLSPSNMGSLFSYLYLHPDQTVSVQQAQDLREWEPKTDFNEAWLDDFFKNKLKKPEPEEYKQKCSIRGGYCDNREVMKKYLMKHGNMEGCVGCCSMCIDASICEFVCDCCRPAPTLTQGLSSLKRFSYRDKVFFIQEDTENSGKFAVYFSIGDSEALRLGTLPSNYDTPDQAVKELEEYAISHNYKEITNEPIISKTQQGTDDEPDDQCEQNNSNHTTKHVCDVPNVSASLDISKGDSGFDNTIVESSAILNDEQSKQRAIDKETFNEHKQTKKDPSISIELKPCPFCGGEAAIQQFAAPKNYYQVYCKECGCGTDGYKICHSDYSDIKNKRANIDTWNCRTQTKY